MQYNSNLISTTLFEASNVSVFKIPPGELSITKWNLGDSNIIWKGNLRLIEQEVIQDDVDLFATVPGSRLHSTDTLTWGNTLSKVRQLDHQLPHNKGPRKPYESLRAKLELFNNVLVQPGVGSLTGGKIEELWAEVWYNPTSVTEIGVVKRDDHFLIANNGQETIQMSKESPKYYKVISQLPSSGYQPFQGTVPSTDSLFNEKGMLLQVALGIKLNDSSDAAGFTDSLSLYKRRFRNVEDQYFYELKLLDIEVKSANLSLNSYPEDSLFPIDDSKHDTTHNRTGSVSSLDRSSDDSDDEFGDFVGS